MHERKNYVVILKLIFLLVDPNWFTAARPEMDFNIYPSVRYNYSPGIINTRGREICPENQSML